MAEKNYGVGYGKPPGQFKPGQSGNPKGRPKGAKNLKTVFEEELQAKVPIKEEGKRKKVTKQEAMVKALMLKAMQGDIKAISAVLSNFMKLMGNQTNDEEEADLSKTDQQILEEFITKVTTTTKASKKGGKS